MTDNVKAKEMFVTKPTKDVKDIFAKWFGGISFAELGVATGWFVITVISVLLFWFLIPGNILKFSLIGSTIVILLIIFIWLIHTRGDGKKQWKHLLDVINFYFRNNFKKLNAPLIYNALNIGSIRHDGLIEFITPSINFAASNVLKTTSGIGSHEHINMMGCLVKLSGVNINLLTNAEANTVINNMANPWLKLGINHKIIIVDEPIDVGPMNSYLQSLIAKYPKKNNNQLSEDDLVKNQLLNYQAINKDIARSEIVNKGIYILIFYSKEKDLSSAISEITNVSNQAKIDVQKITNRTKVCNVLNQLYCSRSSTRFFDGEAEFGICKNLGNIDVEKEYLNVNGQFTKLIEVNQCPSIVTAGWLKKATNYQNIQTIISFEKADTDIIQKNLERAKRRIKLNWENIRSEGEMYNMQEYIQAMESMIHDFAKGYSKAWYVHILFVLHAKSEQELRDLTLQFTKELKSVDRFKFELLNYHQYDVFNNIFSFKWNQKRKILTYCEMSNDSIGAMYPFASNALQDPQGVFLGYESYSGEPFYFDLKIKQDYRNSNVCLVCAKTGGGKTYTVSKICNWFKVIGEKSGMKQYIVDPLGDYSGFLVNYNNVARIDMTDAKNGLINPLQILDEEKDLTTHASEFVVFLSMIAKKTFSAKIERLIIESLLELYSKFKITDTSKQIVDENKEIHRVFEYSRFKSNQWPTTNDFYQFLFKKYRSCPGGSEENDLINIMWKLSKDGQYGKVWNGYTTLNPDRVNINILDTHKLDPDRDPILFKCQMYLISSFLRGEALKNRDRNIGVTNPDDFKWINIVIDEAHRWVKNNPIALKTLELLAREIRHHKGVLVLSTQNIGDFAGEPEAVLKQALYHIILNMTPADVSSYDVLLKESGGLTQNEKDYILNAGVGESLISIGVRYRCYVTIKSNSIEEYMWSHGAK